MLQTAKGQVFVSTGFPVQMFSAKYKKWHAFVGIDMYCVCIGMYFVGPNGYVLAGISKHWVCICAYWFRFSLFRVC